MAAKKPPWSGETKSTVDLTEIFTSSLPLDALLPTLRAQNILTDYEYKQLLPTPLTLVWRNYRFLEYLGSKELSALGHTLSILGRPEHEECRYHREMLKKLFGFEEEEEEMHGNANNTSQQGVLCSSNAKEVTVKDLMQHHSSCHEPLLMAAECSEHGSVLQGKANVKQKLISSLPLDALLPTLRAENILTDYEYKQLLPTPLTLVWRNHRLLEYLGSKELSALGHTLSILGRPEHEVCRYHREMLKKLFGFEEEEEEMHGNANNTSQQGVLCSSNAKEVTDGESNCDLMQRHSSFHEPLLMAAECSEHGSVFQGKANIKLKLMSSLPLDALLPTLHAENVLMDYEYKQLLPTPLTLVWRNQRFLEYLGSKELSVLRHTLSILGRPEHGECRYHREMLKKFFVFVFQEEEEGMHGNAKNTAQQGVLCTSSFKEATVAGSSCDLIQHHSSCLEPLLMAAEYNEHESVFQGKADLKQKLISGLLRDVLLLTLHAENILTEYEYRQLLPTPLTLVCRNHRFLEYLGSKELSVLGHTLSILCCPENEDCQYHREMLKKLFIFEEEEEGMHGNAKKMSRQGVLCSSSAEEATVAGSNCDCIQHNFSCHEPLLMAAEYGEHESLLRGKANLKPKLISGLLLDALLLTLRAKNILTDYEYKQLLPTPLTLVWRNHWFLEYLGSKELSALGHTLSILGRPEHEDCRYHREMLKKLFGFEDENVNCIAHLVNEHSRGDKEIHTEESYSDPIQHPSTQHEPLGTMVSEHSKPESVSQRKAFLRQQLECSLPLDYLLPALHTENVLTDVELEQLLPTPLTLLVRNRNFLDCLGSKDPSAIRSTLSIFNLPERQEYQYLKGMLKELFDYVENEGDRMSNDVSQQEMECISGDKEINGEAGSEVTPSTLASSDALEISPKCSATGTAFLQVLPALELLSRLVVPRVSSRWEYVGLQLGMSAECLKVIELQQFMKMENCCTAMFKKWLQGTSGTGNKNRSWESVLYAVEIGHGTAAVEEIRERLKEVAAQADCRAADLDSVAALESDCILLLQVPTLETVTRLVVPKMSSEWYTVGIHCGITAEVLTVIQEDSNNTKERCSRMFSFWLEKAPGTGDKPRTWATVLEAVQTGYGTKVREQIVAELPSLVVQTVGQKMATSDKSLRAKLGCYYSKECIQDNPLLASSTMQYLQLKLVQPEQHRPLAGRIDETVSVRLASGGVEQVPHEKVSLKYEDIISFSPPAGIHRKRVLIEGVPGIGKSTLIQRICHDWSVGLFAHDFTVVLQVTLRNLPKDQTLSLEDLVFTSVEDEDVAKEIAHFVAYNKGREVLFVFDGFDEMPEKMQKKSIVRSILDGRFAPQSSFVISTRPISAESLYHCVDRRVEICGFAEENVEDFIREYFASSNPSTGKKLLLTLSRRPQFKKLCYVPLQLLMICYTASLGDSTSQLPRTLHELLENLIILTINHNLERESQMKCAGSIQDVSQICRGFDELTHLALQGIEKDTIIFPDFNFEMDSAFHGLFNCIKTRNRFGVISRTWHFLHLILQEFMAALAVAKKTPREQVIFWRQHLTMKYNKYGQFVLADDRYQSMFLLYCGTSMLSNLGIQDMLLETLNTVLKPGISVDTPLPQLCEVVAESGNEELAMSILTSCGPTLTIDDVNLDDSVAWCMDQYYKQVERAGISITGEFTHNVANCVSRLRDVSTLTTVVINIKLNLGSVDDLCSDSDHTRRPCSDMQTVKQFLLKQAQLKCLDFLIDVGAESSMGVTDNPMDIHDTVKDVLAHHKEALEEVAIGIPNGLYDAFCPVPFDPLVESIVTCQKLSSLQLISGNVSPYSLITVLKQLRNLQSLGLKELHCFNQGSIIPSLVDLIASSVEQHPCLSSLTIEARFINSLVKGAVEGMARRHGVEKLVVSLPGPGFILHGYDLIKPICAVMRTGSLNTMWVGENMLPQAELIMKELSHCTHLRELQLDLWINTLLSAEVDLSQCTALQKLTVTSDGQLSCTSSVTSALLQAITLSKSLKVVVLREFVFDDCDQVVKVFASCLKGSQIQRLEFTSCTKLSPTHVATICGSLHDNEILEELVVTCAKGKGEDVSDPDVLLSVIAAITANRVIQRIMIVGNTLNWTNVATAILKGAAANESETLRILELATPPNLPPPQTEVDEVRRINPKLCLVVIAGGDSVEKKMLLGIDPYL